VFDGGAPARILPILNGTSALEQGIYVDVHTDGTLKAFTDDQNGGSNMAQAVGIGVLLSDAAAGAMGNVICGRGIICNVQAGAAGVGAIGDNVCVDELGKLETVATNLETNRAVGVALTASFNGTDSGGNTTSFTKVLLI
jgi:hypothetical protein